MYLSQCKYTTKLLDKVSSCKRVKTPISITEKLMATSSKSSIASHADKHGNSRSFHNYKHCCSKQKVEELCEPLLSSCASRCQSSHLSEKSCGKTKHTDASNGIQKAKNRDHGCCNEVNHDIHGCSGPHNLNSCCQNSVETQCECVKVDFGLHEADPDMGKCCGGPMKECCGKRETETSMHECMGMEKREIGGCCKSYVKDAHFATCFGREATVSLSSGPSWNALLGRRYSLTANQARPSYAAMLDTGNFVLAGQK